MRMTKIFWIAIPAVFVLAIALTFLGPAPEAKPEVKLRQIVVIADANDLEDVERAREKVEMLFEQLEQGTDFAQVAIEHSEALNSSDGGDMGWIGPGILPANLEEVAFALESGECSDPIEESRGQDNLIFRILYVEDRRNF